MTKVNASTVGEPFFHRHETHSLIERVSELDPLVLFAAAGATFDSSNRDWSGLVNGLLAPHLDEASRKTLLDKQGPQRAASAACQFYRDLYAEQEDYRMRILDRLRVLLYEEGVWGKGHLTDNIAELVYLWNEFGRGACVVTPNFDDYIERALIGRLASPDTLDVYYCSPRKDLPEDEGKRLPNLAQAILPNTERVGCVYLCGHAPKSGTSISHPVLSETDFFERQVETQETLHGIFRRSNVVIVGSSLTDPPLLQALMATAADSAVAGYERYAFFPLQGSEWKDVPADLLPGLQRATRERLNQFNVKPIFTDYFTQVAQFLHEVCVCTRHGANSENKKYSTPLSKFRYGARLVSWWDRWSAANFTSPSERQSEHTDFLYQSLRDVRRLLNTPPAEVLKIEVWLRWEPKSTRKLRLWASSSGTWTDMASMRDADVAVDSDYCSVISFSQGRPILGEPQNGKKVRWCSYLSKPIWWEEGIAEGADEISNNPKEKIPVGVITLASMADQETGSISPGNKARISEVIKYLDEVAGLIVTP